MNLLRETTEKLARHGKTYQNVKYVIDEEQIGSWDAFAEVAKDYNYDNGYGGVEVNEDMKIVGDGWWLERAQYDGSEWWIFKQAPIVTNQNQVQRFDVRDNWARKDIY